MSATCFTDLLSQLHAAHELELEALREELLQPRGQGEGPVPGLSSCEKSFHASEGAGGTVVRKSAVSKSAEAAPRKKGHAMTATLLQSCAEDVPQQESAVWSPLTSRVECELRKRVPVKKLFIPVLNGCEYVMFTEEPPRSGFLARIVDSRAFRGLVTFMICCNTVFIAVSTDRFAAEAFEHAHQGTLSEFTRVPLVEDIFESLFTFFYLFELAARLLVHRVYFFKCPEWQWNTLDTLLVVTSLVHWLAEHAETNALPSHNMSFVRVLRALKVAKVLRMFRAVQLLQQLRLMMECILGCMEALTWCLLLVAFFLFLFSVVFVQGLSSHVAQTNNLGMPEVDKIEQRFGGIVSAITSLYQATTGGCDWDDVYEIVKLGGQHLQILFLLFIAFFTVAFWNIITSLFIERALKLAMPDVDALVKDKRMNDIQYVQEMTMLLNARFDTNHDGLITFEEFTNFFHDDKFTSLRDFFAVRGLNLKDASTFFNMLAAASEYEGAVDIKTFVGGCLRLQGLATSLDLMTFQFEMNHLLREHTCMLEHSLALLESVKLGLLGSSPRNVPCLPHGEVWQTAPSPKSCEHDDENKPSMPVRL